MPKKPRTPSYRCHAPSNQAVVTIDGRDIYLGLHKSKISRERYDATIAEWLAHGRRLPTASTDITVSELIAAFWRFAQEYYRKEGEPTVQVAKIKAAVRQLKRLYGRTPVSDFGPLRFKAVRQAFIDAGSCRVHVNQQAGIIKQAFKWGTEQELVPPSVFHGLQSVAGLRRGRSAAPESEPVRPVPEAHVDAVLPLVPRQIRALIEIQLLTGCRPSEARLMRACDIDMTGRIWSYRPSRHKTQHHGIDRVIYLGPRCQDVIRQFLKTESTAFLFSPRDADAERKAEKRRLRKSKVQPSQRDRSKRNPEKEPGDCYRMDSYRHAIKRACEAADVPVWSPGQLRHNAATRFRKEYGLEVAQIILGHRSAEVTQIYAERDKDRALAVVSKIG